MSSSSILQPRLADPIFVLGALRSGTTLFRLMLDSHESIANPGEVDFIFDYLKIDAASNKWTCEVESLRVDRTFRSYNLDVLERKDGKRIALDLVRQLRQRSHGYLTLNIHRNVDKVAALFPNARILHIIRDPRDVARSCVDMGWAGNAYFGVDQWLETEKNWDISASRFRSDSVLEFCYEDLILNAELQLAKICQFIGVPYSAAMLSYPGHSTYQAPDSSAVQQWEKSLGKRDVALVETKTGSLLTARGYKPSGYPLDPPGSMEKLRLFCANKAHRWQFSCRRYGVVNFLTEKITRRFLRSRHHVLIQKMGEIENQHLK